MFLPPDRIARLGTAFVAFAAVCWGFAGGIGGVLVDRDWNPVVVALSRGMIGLLFVLAWLAVRPQNNGLRNGRLWFWSVIAGVGIAGNFAFYFKSIVAGGVSIAATLMYCAPVFVYLISFMLRLERPTPFKWAAIGMVLLGIILLTGAYKIDASDVTLVTVVFGLLSGLSYAVFIFGFRYATPRGSPQAILMIAFTVLVVLLGWQGGSEQIKEIPVSPSWPLFVVLGVFGAGLSFIAYIVGIKHTVPTVAAIVAMVEPVTASLFGVIILNESLAAMQILGMGLILYSVSLLARRSPDY